MKCFFLCRCYSDVDHSALTNAQSITQPTRVYVFAL